MFQARFQEAFLNFGKTANCVQFYGIAWILSDIEKGTHYHLMYS